MRQLWRGLRRVELGGGTYLDDLGKEFTLRRFRLAKKSAPDVGVWPNVGFWIDEKSFKPEEVEALVGLVEGVTCNLETLSEEIYRDLRPGLSLRVRKLVIEEADRSGLSTDTTLMIGSGLRRGNPQPYREWVDFLTYVKGLRNFRILEIHPFRPVWKSPTESAPPGSVLETLKVMAVARLMLRDVWLSGAHSVEGLMAGANLIMHAYPITKSFRPWGYSSRYSSIFASRIKALVDDAVVVDNLFEVTRAAKGLGLSIEGGL